VAVVVVVVAALAEAVACLQRNINNTSVTSHAHPEVEVAFLAARREKKDKWWCFSFCSQYPNR
jgi:hypothetical protein